MSTTYGEARTPKQVEIDEVVMERVMEGMAFLKEKYGPDYVEHIDLLKLDVSDPFLCPLGQLYADATPTPEQWQHLWDQGYRNPLEETTDGFTKAIAIIDGDLLHTTDQYGFDEGWDDDSNEPITHDELTDAWREAIRRERIDRYTVE